MQVIIPQLQCEALIYPEHDIASSHFQLIVFFSNVKDVPLLTVVFFREDSFSSGLRKQFQRVAKWPTHSRTTPFISCFKNKLHVSQLCDGTILKSFDQYWQNSISHDNSQLFILHQVHVSATYYLEQAGLSKYNCSKW